MKIGMIGLGKMGANMALRLMRGGHECVAFDLKAENIEAIAKQGATPAFTLRELVQALPKPRAIWLMVPAGAPTESMVNQLSETLESGDIVIDGGNSYFKDDVRRSKLLKTRGIHFCDAGTSGGIWGLERGYSLMIGAEKEIFQKLQPIFKTLAPGRGTIQETQGRKGGNTAEEGYLHCGPVGAGHFVKMVHNGIEYGMMQSFAEGFDILKNANSKELADDHQFDLNLADVAEVWRRGSVVASWLLDLLAIALTENSTLSEFTGFVHDSGEGRWTIQAAIEESVPAEVLAASLFTRFRSRQEHTFAEKVLSAMRAKFGGHREEGGKTNGH